MSLDTYRVRCAKGHEPVELTGAAAVAHAEACTGRKLGTVPAGYGDGRKFCRPRPSSAVVKAQPWKAPRPAAGGLERVAADLAAGKYDVTTPAYVAGVGVVRESWRPGEAA